MSASTELEIKFDEFILIFDIISDNSFLCLRCPLTSYFCITSMKAEDCRELEASMEMTDRHSGSSFRYNT